MKSQSDINSSSFEEVETHGPCCQLGRSGGVTAAGKQEFSPSTFPPTSSATLIPHIYFKLSTYFPLNTFPPTHTSRCYTSILNSFPKSAWRLPAEQSTLSGELFALGGTYHHAFSLPQNTTHRTELKYQMLITIVRLLLFLF